MLEAIITILILGLLVYVWSSYEWKKFCKKWEREVKDER